MLTKILACPVCHGRLSYHRSYTCRGCGLVFPDRLGIPNFIPGSISPQLDNSQQRYEQLHRTRWDKINDGSYEILAAFARGNRTLDIACGDGFIETLVPNTVGLDFSRNALTKARRNGAKYLVQATAEQLPFRDNAFDLAICAGSLEHFASPQAAIYEMARVSRLQILTVHREFSFPGSRILRSITTRALGIKNQPIETPLTLGELKKLLQIANLHPVFQGVWTLPVNYGGTITKLPLPSIPSSHFVISYKK